MLKIKEMSAEDNVKREGLSKECTFHLKTKGWKGERGEHVPMSCGQRIQADWRGLGKTGRPGAQE